MAAKPAADDSGKPRPKGSELVRSRVLLHGASFALVTALLLSLLLGRPGSKDDAAKDERRCSPMASAAANVYGGDLTPLQGHAAFFDRDKDGVICPSETYQGFRAIGCGVALSAIAAVFINGGLGPKTIPVSFEI
nr:unnamed protein product [Digitaria exilis]